jgi:hypothetical protein
VGKPSGREASGGVPTIPSPHAKEDGGHGAQEGAFAHPTVTALLEQIPPRTLVLFAAMGGRRKNPMKSFVKAGLVAIVFAAATAASAMPLVPGSALTDPAIVQVKGGHGHGHGHMGHHGGRGHHYGWHRGRGHHYGWHRGRHHHRHHY